MIYENSTSNKRASTIWQSMFEYFAVRVLKVPWHIKEHCRSYHCILYHRLFSLIHQYVLRSGSVISLNVVRRLGNDCNMIKENPDFRDCSNCQEKLTYLNSTSAVLVPLQAKINTQYSNWPVHHQYKNKNHHDIVDMTVTN